MGPGTAAFVVDLPAPAPACLATKLAAMSDAISKAVQRGTSFIGGLRDMQREYKGGGREPSFQYVATDGGEQPLFVVAKLRYDPRDDTTAGASPRPGMGSSGLCGSRERSDLITGRPASAARGGSTACDPYSRP